MRDNDLTARLLHDLEPFSERLYMEAASGARDDSSDTVAGEICPLYRALDQIEERYGALEPLGMGGTKEVFRVYDALAARYVALAKPLSSLSSDWFDTFLREAHLTARLEHPCIIRLFDMGIDPQGRPFFTMELMKGRSLRQILQAIANEGSDREQFPIHRRLAIFLRVCEAIAYAHSRRILHLDIKPENIQVGEYGEVHVCDWGLAVMLPGEQQSTSEMLLDSDLYCSLHRTVDGTPVYMSPEQHDYRQPKMPQMDLYALGCVLQEMITLNSPAIPLTRCASMPEGLGAVISRAKSHGSERYQSVNELHTDIIRYLTGYSTSAQKVGLFSELLLFYRRNRTTSRVAGGLFAVLFFTIAVAVYEIDGKRQEADAASARYYAQKLHAEDMLQKQANSVFNQSVFLTDSWMAETALFSRSVEYSLRQLKAVTAHEPPPNSPAWYQTFWILFLQQNLKAAIKIDNGEKNLVEVADLVAAAHQFSSRVNGDNFLPTEGLVALIHHLGTEAFPNRNRPRYPLIERMLIYDTRYSRSIPEREEILAAVLKILNPEWEAQRLAFDEATESLSIRGKGLRHLRMIEGNYPTNQSLLRVFNPRTLDLRGTDISDLAHLAGLELAQLDLRRTPASDLTPLAGMRSLREIVCAPGQFGPANRDTLPRTIRIVEKTEDEPL